MHKKTLVMFVLFLIAVLIVPAAVDARHRYHSYAYAKQTTATNPWKFTPTTTSTPAPSPTTSTKPATTKPVTTPKPAPTPVQTPPVSTPAPAPGETTFSAYVTGYSYWDNTPPGTAEISHGVIHSKAAGTGTYSDPITLAVGHSIINGKDILDYPAGTKFYLPYLQKYAIVEDTCGDGNSPQNGPCHTGFKGNVWVDLYVDGQNISRSISDNCMNTITGVHPIIKNPGANYPVTPGALSVTGCKIF